MKWRLVEVEDHEALPNDLTDEEIVTISVRLAQCGDAPITYNAWCKVQPAFNKANYRGD
jgi:hypothetical protein